MWNVFPLSSVLQEAGMKFGQTLSAGMDMLAPRLGVAGLSAR